MHQHFIHKMEPAKFSLRWIGQKQALIMDFNPIIKKYQLKDEFVLLHWQAKPKFIRTWGLYDGKSDSYNCISTSIVFPSIAARLVDVNESVITTVPTAMILYSGCRYLKDMNRIKFNESISGSNINTNRIDSDNNGTLETISKSQSSNKKG